MNFNCLFCLNYVQDPIKIQKELLEIMIDTNSDSNYGYGRLLKRDVLWFGFFTFDIIFKSDIVSKLINKGLSIIFWPDKNAVATHIRAALC